MNIEDKKYHEICLWISENPLKALQIIEVWLDLYVNDDNPYHELCNGDVVIYSKYGQGREAVLDVLSRQEDQNNIDVTEYDYAIALMSDEHNINITDGANEYCMNNGINIR